MTNQTPKHTFKVFSQHGKPTCVTTTTSGWHGCIKDSRIQTVTGRPGSELVFLAWPRRFLPQTIKRKVWEAISSKGSTYENNVPVLCNIPPGGAWKCSSIPHTISKPLEAVGKATIKGPKSDIPNIHQELLRTMLAVLDFIVDDIE